MCFPVKRVTNAVVNDYLSDGAAMPDEDAPWTADDLRAWRGRLGLTQAMAADAFGVHLHALKNWEGGRRPVGPIIKRFAAALERERQASVDGAIMEAAWLYLGTVAASTSEWSTTGRLSELHTRPVAAAVETLRTLLEGPRASAVVERRARWLTVLASSEVRRIEAVHAAAQASALLPEPLAVDARHATLADVASTILVGGKSTGISLNSIPLLLDTYLVENDEQPDPNQEVRHVRGNRSNDRRGC